MSKGIKDIMVKVMTVGMLTMVGCSPTTGGTGVGAENSEEVEKFILDYPESMQEQFGESIELAKTPEKIVVLTTTPVQTLYELGINMEAIPANSNIEWPVDIDAEIMQVDMMTIDVEAVLARDPDLLILSEYSAAGYQQTFEDNGITCYFTSAFKDLDSIKEEVDIFAKAFGKEDKAKEILQSFDDIEDEIAEISSKIASPKTLVISGYPIEYVQTSDGFTGYMASLFNVDNITTEAQSMAGTTAINMENIVNENPELIIAIGSSLDESEIKENYQAEFAKNPEVWNSVEAVKNDNIIYLDKTFAKSAGLRILDNLQILCDKFTEKVNE